MSQVYKIAKGTILANKGRTTRPYKAGEMIASDCLSPVVLRELIADGTLIAVDKAMPVISDAEETAKLAMPPLKAASASSFMKDENIPQLSDGKSQEGQIEDIKHKVETGGVTVSMHTPAPKADVAAVSEAAKGIWNFSPSELLVKPLNELNAMIIERKADEKPFEDKAEAIAFLSQDYVEKK